VILDTAPEAVPRVVQFNNQPEYGAMRITEVRVNLQHEEVLKAFVSITLDDEGSDGRFVAMPARKRRDGSFQDIAHPINRQTRDYLEATVLRAYDEALGHSVGMDDGREGDEVDDRDDAGPYAQA
jgi:stage V sporulation protein G